MTCGFKSHLPHQTKVPMAYPAMGIFVWYSELRTCCKGDRRLRRIQGAGAGAAVEEGKRHKTRSLIRAPQVGTGRRHRSAGTNSPVDCWLARGKVPSSAPKRDPNFGSGLFFLYISATLANPVESWYTGNAASAARRCTTTAGGWPHFPRGGETMRITMHIGSFTVTIIIKKRKNRHSAK